MIATFWHDLRQAVRAVANNPGFSMVAIVSIAIGVGANAAMFSVADGLLLRPLPVPHAADAVTISVRTPAGETMNAGLSYPDYRDLRDHTRSFTGMLAFRGVLTTVAVTADDAASARYGYAVSGNFFDLLQVTTVLGRPVTAADDRPSAEPVVVIGWDTWRQQFAADPRIVGRRIRLGGREATVIGVAPASFSGLDPYLRPAFFVPLAAMPDIAMAGDGPSPDLRERRDVRVLRAIGRLAPGVTVMQADAEVAAFGARLAAQYPETNRRYGLGVRTPLAARASEYRPAAILAGLLGVLAALVLLVACANLSGLLASRTPARAREVAIRLSIGGSRVRVVGQLVAETCVVAVAGAGAGLGLAYLGVMVFEQFQLATDVGVRLTYTLDGRALAMALAVAMFTAIASSILPAWRATRVTDLTSTLRGATAADARLRVWGRQGLVATQVASSLLLVTLAASFQQAFQAQLGRGPGFRTDGIVLMNLDPALAGYTQARADIFYDTLRQRAAAIPGVTAVTLTSFAPLSADTVGRTRVIPDDVRLGDGIESVPVLISRVDDAYFETTAIPIRGGRAFLPSDDSRSPRVAVVNQQFAAHYWPGQEAVGKHVRLGGPDGPLAEVIGVAASTVYRLMGEPPSDLVYVPRTQDPQRRLTLLVATRDNAAALPSVLRRVVRDLGSDVPVFGVWTMPEYLATSTSYQTAIVRVASGMGALGLVLALIGLYALVAYVVSRRTREIGIRMAVGESPAAAVRRMVRYGLVPAVAGAIVGLPVSLAAAGAMRALFPETAQAVMPIYFTVVPLLLLVVLTAAVIPARREALIDPLRALRQD